jgi:hypothetical protein
LFNNNSLLHPYHGEKFVSPFICSFFIYHATNISKNQSLFISQTVSQSGVVFSFSQAFISTTSKTTPLFRYKLNLESLETSRSEYQLLSKSAETDARVFSSGHLDIT